jgi:hypothetical protein
VARFVNYRCPDCEGEFRWFHHPSDAPPPDRCQLCGSWMSDEEPFEEIFVPQSPGIRKSAYAKSVDQTYRAMEAQSIGRADAAADQLADTYRSQPHDEEFSGLVKVSQQEQIAQLKSDLKITNMKDPSEMREGDTAVVGPSATAAAQNLTTNTSKPGFVQYGEGVPAVMPGNAAVVSNITRDHTPRAMQMIKAGQMGKY